MWWSSTPPGGSQQAWETSLPGVSLLLLARAAGTIQTSRRTSPSNVQRMTWPGPVEPERPVNPQSMPLSSPVWRIAARRRRAGLRQPAGSGARSMIKSASIAPVASPGRPLTANAMNGRMASPGCATSRMARCLATARVAAAGRHVPHLAPGRVLRIGPGRTRCCHTGRNLHRSAAPLGPDRPEG
jgi:hypothetical protein